MQSLKESYYDSFKVRKLVCAIHNCVNKLGHENPFSLECVNSLFNHVQT